MFSGIVEEMAPENYFKPGMCDGVFRTREYTYHPEMLVHR